MSNRNGSFMRLLTTRELSILISLAEEGSFTLAADRLGITQSAVSRSLQLIERTYGIQLFVRGRNGAVPTDALIQILPQLRELHRGVEGVSLALGASKERLRGNITIVGFRSAVTHILPPAVSKLMERHEGFRVSLSTVREQGGGVQQVVEDGHADFGITSVKPTRALRSTYLGSDAYVLVRKKSSKRGRSQDRLVFWNERCSDLIPTILAAHKWSVETQMKVDSDTAVLGMISHGGGFTIMPELAVEPLPTGLEKVRLKGDFRRGVWLCASSRAWNSPSGRALIRSVRDAAKQRLSAAPPTSA